MFTVRFHTHTDLPDEDAHILAESLMDIAISSAAAREGKKHKGAWILEWLVEQKPLQEDIVSRLSLQAAIHNFKNLRIETSQVEIEKTPDINWLEKTYQEFPPFSIGSFFIHGSHYKNEIPDDQIALQIDAATAFGSGEHGTTKGCIEAMIDLKAQGVCPWNVLDMGAGSGILAIAAWKLWKTPILAVDNDPESVRMTGVHAEMNGVALSSSALSTACGDGFYTPAVNKKRPYELILANILAGPVIEMAPNLVHVLDNNGYCILSGMLNEQANLVASAYEGENLTLFKRYDIEEWTTLVMHKA
ncbi:MAG: hypothetical protein GC137_06985 [Alphaproteobacteria bacterium]|nr:hypothetical protein [Alphaproteobacteria bacterium]